MKSFKKISYNKIPKITVVNKNVVTEKQEVVVKNEHKFIKKEDVVVTKKDVVIKKEDHDPGELFIEKELVIEVGEVFNTHNKLIQESLNITFNFNHLKEYWPNINKNN